MWDKEKDVFRTELEDTEGVGWGWVEGGQTEPAFFFWHKPRLQWSYIMLARVHASSMLALS